MKEIKRNYTKQDKIDVLNDGFIERLNQSLSNTNNDNEFLLREIKTHINTSPDSKEEITNLLKKRGLDDWLKEKFVKPNPFRK